MLSDIERTSLNDILLNIEFADRFVEGFDYEDVLDDTRTFYALVRCLEIISEASRRLSLELKSRHPEVPWRQIAGSGNVYRHEYEDVAHRLVWGTVKAFLPKLKRVVEIELSSSD